jgi:hypothetical protein
MKILLVLAGALLAAAPAAAQRTGFERSRASASPEYAVRLAVETLAGCLRENQSCDPLHGGVAPAGQELAAAAAGSRRRVPAPAHGGPLWDLRLDVGSVQLSEGRAVSRVRCYLAASDEGAGELELTFRSEEGTWVLENPGPLLQRLQELRRVLQRRG